MLTRERVTLALASLGTSAITQQLIISLWTLTPAIAQMIPVYAHFRRLTTVVPRTGSDFTIMLILSMYTVFINVAPGIDRQTIQLFRGTTIMRIRTGLFSFHQPEAEVTNAIQVDKNPWRHDSSILHEVVILRFYFIRAHCFIRVIHAV